VRIVAATNRPLEDDIAVGRFRQDLYFRLNTATVVVPPLRDRPLDLPVLARVFLSEGCKREQRDPMAVSSQAMQRLALHDWPGNVRELRNLMDYVAATVVEPVLDAGHLPDRIAAKAAPWMLPKTPTQASAPARAPGAPGFRNIYEEIEELERTRIREALEAADGVRVRAAELIGMPLRTMVTKIKVYGLANTPSRRGRADP
jgi:DNA-binding NtrC family response regulator